MIQEKPKSQKAKIAVVELNIIGTATHYDDKIWVDDPNEDDGGGFQPIKKKYDQPRIALSFVGETDIDLEIGSYYTDGINSFVAIGKNKLSNYSHHVKEFKIPTELFKFSKPVGV